MLLNPQRVRSKKLSALLKELMSIQPTHVREGGGGEERAKKKRRLEEQQRRLRVLATLPKEKDIKIVSIVDAIWRFINLNPGQVWDDTGKQRIPGHYFLELVPIEVVHRFFSQDPEMIVFYRTVPMEERYLPSIDKLLLQWFTAIKSMMLTTITNAAEQLVGSPDKKNILTTTERMWSANLLQMIAFVLLDKEWNPNIEEERAMVLLARYALGLEESIIRQLLNSDQGSVTGLKMTASLLLLKIASRPVSNGVEHLYVFSRVEGFHKQRNFHVTLLYYLPYSDIYDIGYSERGGAGSCLWYQPPQLYYEEPPLRKLPPPLAFQCRTCNTIVTPSADYEASLVKKRRCTTCSENWTNVATTQLLKLVSSPKNEPIPSIVSKVIYFLKEGADPDGNTNRIPLTETLKSYYNIQDSIENEKFKLYCQKLTAVYKAKNKTLDLKHATLDPKTRVWTASYDQKLGRLKFKKEYVGREDGVVEWKDDGSYPDNFSNLTRNNHTCRACDLNFGIVDSSSTDCISVPRSKHQAFSKLINSKTNDCRGVVFTPASVNCIAYGWNDGRHHLCNSCLKTYGQSRHLVSETYCWRVVLQLLLWSGANPHVLREKDTFKDLQRACPQYLDYLTGHSRNNKGFMYRHRTVGPVDDGGGGTQGSMSKLTYEELWYATMPVTTLPSKRVYDGLPEHYKIGGLNWGIASTHKKQENGITAYGDIRRGPLSTFNWSSKQKEQRFFLEYGISKQVRNTHIVQSIPQYIVTNPREMKPQHFNNAPTFQILEFFEEKALNNKLRSHWNQKLNEEQKKQADTLRSQHKTTADTAKNNMLSRRNAQHTKLNNL